MKLVIHTQHRENCDPHQSILTRQGESPQYWKNKGGAVYVVEGITVAQRLKIMGTGIPTLTNLIEKSDDDFIEYIIDYKIVGEHEETWSDYDHPWFLKYDHKSGWIGTRYPPGSRAGQAWKELLDLKND